ncbi:MAG: EAL domain-containing protein [Lachnospiraceae bacterium]|nr:EAL domain-containing protein [Lachnospiraceae bacterium]
MFTWNYPYISRARLETDLSQILPEQGEGDVLVRIHTAIHLGEEAVELARFIKSLVPKAKIIGTSTSAVINHGKLSMNQCVISVTATQNVSIHTAIIPTVNDATGVPLSADGVCGLAKPALMQPGMKLLFAFLAGTFYDFERMVDQVNICAPDVCMTGGIVNYSHIGKQKDSEGGFVFDENGFSKQGLLFCSLAGEELAAITDYATGAQAIGDPYPITDAFGSCILKLGEADAAKEYRSGVGNALRRRPEIANLFPLVYADEGDIPVPITYAEGKTLAELFPPDNPAYKEAYAARPDIDPNAKRERLFTNHNVTVGRNLRRAFIYDRKIIADNHVMFRRIENFEKAQTITGYLASARSGIYSNCAKWELSVYENSNICGCVTDGEIVRKNGRNILADCAFTVAAFGEAPMTQEYNPYAFSHTDSLAADNQALLSYLLEVETQIERRPSAASAAAGLRQFVRDCELKLLYSEQEDIPNEAAMNMDMKLHGYDRICMIRVPDTTGMKVVFDEDRIALTERSFISRCSDFAEKHHYKMYRLDKWQVAVGAPSYVCSLRTMQKHMEQLQKILFLSSEGLIAIVPIFCIINGATVENLKQVYNSASIEMSQKNTQFYVCDAMNYQPDEESIRKRYRMINVINYAIAHDAVIPYYQGIHDNATGTIHHYEALMRIQDEEGNVYTPYHFLDIARSYGLLYDSISAIMVRKVFEKFKNCADIGVSINLSMRDIRNREMLDYIYDMLSVVDHPENFVFEILENEEVDVYELVEDFVDRIHQLGALVSIDDFGSGYSNLQHIVSIHADFIKIDGSIIKQCFANPEAKNLITLIMGWKQLSDQNLWVVAEFVENKEIQSILLKYGVDFSQGYLFSRPEKEIML